MVEKIAAARGLQVALIHDDTDDPALRNTDWVLVARTREILDREALRKSAIAIKPIPGIGVWTDDFNNLFEVLK